MSEKKVLETDKKRLENWTAPDPNMLPDFVIAGTMKSGTTTLHRILDKHPKIFMPAQEIGFFDMDNPLQHGDFNFYHPDKDRWTTQSMKDRPQKMWDWYLNKFSAAEKPVKGEDSPTYITFKTAAERIALQKKPVKLIFLLRQPSLRAYSNYYHLFRRGKAIYSFENTLRFIPHSILSRSLYKQQLEYYYQFIPANRIKVFLFEDLITKTADVIREICGFLNINFDEFPANVMQTHANVAKLPLFGLFQRVKNYHMQGLGRAYYADLLPNAPDYKRTRASVMRIVNAAHFFLNPQIRRKPPEINPGTKAFLDEYFYKELQGIDELVGTEILSRWFEFNTK